MADPADLHLVVVMIDMDRFKRLNDTRGHAASDQALAAVGWAIRQASPDTAIIGRAGGEEFVVIDALPKLDAERLAVRLCTALSALPHRVTASVGAAIVPAMSFPDPRAATDVLVADADAAMYRAKREGGNRVVFHGVTQPAP